jgi:uncharacterized membrane protein
MNDAVWAPILLAAALVFATRALGPMLMSGVALSPKLVRFLDALGVSVIAAIVATALVHSGLREFAAAGAAAAVMLAARSALWAMAAGVLVAAGWANLVAN